MLQIQIHPNMKDIHYPVCHLRPRQHQEGKRKEEETDCLGETSCLTISLNLSTCLKHPVVCYAPSSWFVWILLVHFICGSKSGKRKEEETDCLGDTSCLTISLNLSTCLKHPVVCCTLSSWFVWILLVHFYLWK